MRLADVRKAKVELEASISGVEEKLKFSFRPHVYTPAMVAEDAAAMAGASGQAEQMEGTVRLVSRVVADWDLVRPVNPDKPDGPQEPVPLTVEALREVPNAVLTAVLDAIAQYHQLDPTKRGSFGGP